MNAYHIQLKEKRPRTGQYVWIIFECEHPTVEALTEDLNSGRLVAGYELITVGCENDRDRREVVEVRGCALRLPDIHRVGIPRWDLFRYED